MTDEPDFEYMTRLNRPVLELDDAHPAKRFLLAFMDCQSNCVGQELGQFRAPVDQEWVSATDGERWTFSAFAYKILSFDLELDGFLQRAPRLTASEQGAIERLPSYRTLMTECAEAARKKGNTDVLELTDQVLETLDLWEEYLRFREKMIAQLRE